jgi:hypothetical protein
LRGEMTERPAPMTDQKFECIVGIECSFDFMRDAVDYILPCSRFARLVGDCRATEFEEDHLTMLGGGAGVRSPRSK